MSRCALPLPLWAGPITGVDMSVSLDQPLVTIGMPVRNGGKTLRRVLDSLVSQTYRNFKMVISDNASTDETQGICQEFAQRDSRIIYIRQPQNVGLERNFDFVLSRADTEFFVWAAADDIRSSDFLELNVKFLQDNPEFIGSTSPVRFEGGDFDPAVMGDHTLDCPDAFDRIVGFFGVWHANGRMFSVMRRGAMPATLSETTYLGADWSFILRLLARGKFKRLNDGFIILGRNGASNRNDYFSKYRSRAVSWVIPVYDLSIDVLRLSRGASLSQKLKLISHLCRLNASAFKVQLKHALKKSAA